MSVEEQNCRICRGEATPEDPLFYPCKCRGSIKYIHQGCLEEWLKHSGREPSCDICHQKYKFTTQFKEDTPDRVPLRLILIKLRDSSFHLLRYGLTIAGLVFGVGIQIPLFWKATSRFFTWIIDGAMPHESLLESLIYGETKVEGDPLGWVNIWKALTKTYFDSLTFLCIWIAIHLVLFLEHEWVSRDPGFKTLILKKIGPAENLARPTAAAAAAAMRNRNPQQFNERMFRDVQNLERLLDQRNNPQNAVIQDALRIIQERQRALQREHENQLHNQAAQDGLLEEEDEEQDPDFVPTDSSDNESDQADERRDHADAEAQRPAVLDIPQRVMHIHEPGDIIPEHLLNNPNVDHRFAILDDLRNAANERPVNERPANNGLDIDMNLFNRNLVNEGPDQFDNLFGNPAAAPAAPPAAPGVLNRNGLNNIPNINLPHGNRFDIDMDVDPAAAAAAAAAVNAIPAEQDDLLLSLPIYMIIVGGDAFLGAYLFLAYFLPSGVGNILYIALYMSIKGIFHALNALLVVSKLNGYTDKLLSFILAAKDHSPVVSNFLDEYLINPVVRTLVNVYEHNLPQSTLERSIPLFITYGGIYTSFLVILSMKTKQHSKNNPLLGIQRKIFIILLDFVSTLKVFLIFAIELVFFPVYCGFLLEVVCTPFFTVEVPFVLSKVFVVGDNLFLRCVAYWAAGTVYMCLFALFVGMTRRYILRPGVLFFIRSPEDPNARLIHDALVRPLGLQISRIALSGFVYSIFILVGFGAVSYSLKLTNSPVIPLRYNPLLSTLLGNVTIYRARENLDLIKKYVRQYWIRAFRISSAKLRLSSFILGKHDQRERGYVVYRNLASRIQKAKPDYTEPKTLNEAKKIFRTTDTKAVFIPDGDLIRAPKNDTVSRKFVRKLFIPVTKDDKPLKSTGATKTFDDRYPLDEFDESEDESTTTNHYEIVYRPPHFGCRIILFLTMLWIFSVLLIGGVTFWGNLMGKPITYAIFKAEAALKGEVTKWNSLLVGNVSDFGLFSLDTTSLLVSFQISITALKIYDDWLQRRHIQIEEPVSSDDNNAEANVINIEIPIIDARPDDGRNVMRDVLGFVLLNFKMIFITSFYFANLFAWLYLGISAHLNAIEEPYRYYSGKSEVMDTSSMTFTLNRYTVPFHLILMFYSLFPIQERFRTDARALVRDGLRDGLGGTLTFREIFNNYTRPVLIRLASVELIVALIKSGLVFYEYNENARYYTSLKAVFTYVFVQEAIYRDIIVYSWSGVFAFNILIRGLIKGGRLLKNVNQQIKEEYYTTGKTLENAEITEEPIELTEQ